MPPPHLFIMNDNGKLEVDILPSQLVGGRKVFTINTDPKWDCRVTSYDQSYHPAVFTLTCFKGTDTITQ